MREYPKKRNEKISQAMQKNWQDPEYRKKTIEAQRGKGWRT